MDDLERGRAELWRGQARPGHSGDGTRAALAAVLAVGLGMSRPVALATATPWLVLWFVSPLVAWWISRPAARQAAELSNDQAEFLNDLAGKTWRFFETFVGPEDHWLPPDNFQEHPRAVIAHRTSPTNMGLALLANLAAYDFGYISADGLFERHVADALDDGGPRAIPGPPLQLVRHADAPAVAAAVRFDGG